MVQPVTDDHLGIKFGSPSTDVRPKTASVNKSKRIE